MKTKILLCLAALFAVSRAEACDGCCAADKSMPASTAPLSNRSLYQLDSAWADDAGRPFRLAELRGQPVVLAMFFTNCEYACPILVHDMKAIREALPAATRDQTRFILVSFDTARDTPAALHAYRERALLGDDWTLLHGDADAVKEFAMLLGVKYRQDARGQFSHSSLITVLNREGEIAFQRAGLQGDLTETAHAIVLAAGHEKAR